MLPVTGNILEQDFKVVQMPSKTFRLDTERKRVIGTVDGLEAVKQAVFFVFLIQNGSTGSFIAGIMVWSLMAYLGSQQGW